MGQTEHALRDSDTPQYRPAAWVDAVTANFVARKFRLFEQERFQSRARAKRRAGRARRARAADDHIVAHGV